MRWALVTIAIAGLAAGLPPRSPAGRRSPIVLDAGNRARDRGTGGFDCARPAAGRLGVDAIALVSMSAASRSASRWPAPWWR